MAESSRNLIDIREGSVGNSKKNYLEITQMQESLKTKLFFKFKFPQADQQYIVMKEKSFQDITRTCENNIEQNKLLNQYYQKNQSLFRDVYIKKKIGKQLNEYKRKRKFSERKCPQFFLQQDEIHISKQKALKQHVFLLKNQRQQGIPRNQYGLQISQEQKIDERGNHTSQKIKADSDLPNQQQQKYHSQEIQQQQKYKTQIQILHKNDRIQKLAKTNKFLISDLNHLQLKFEKSKRNLSMQQEEISRLKKSVQDIRIQYFYDHSKLIKLLKLQKLDKTIQKVQIAKYLEKLCGEIGKTFEGNCFQRESDEDDNKGVGSRDRKDRSGSQMILKIAIKFKQLN